MGILESEKKARDISKTTTKKKIKRDDNVSSLFSGYKNYQNCYMIRVGSVWFVFLRIILLMMISYCFFCCCCCFFFGKKTRKELRKWRFFSFFWAILTFHVFLFVFPFQFEILIIIKPIELWMNEWLVMCWWVCCVCVGGFFFAAQLIAKC